MTAAELADDLVRMAEQRLAALIDVHLPDLRVPGVFAGHRVGSDVRADLAFTLGLLGQAGVASVAGVAIREAITRVLVPIDGAETAAFFSYRVAETLHRFGPFDGNPLLADCTDKERANIANACDSTSWIELLDRGSLPQNYAAVLARCELGRHRLGLTETTDDLDDLIDRTAALLAENPLGFLDDSRAGSGRYDIYAADVCLFTEPFAERLGEPWRRAADATVDLVARVGATNGAAVPWGRSTGVLATCLTLELAGLVRRHRLAPPHEQAAWIRRAGVAAGEMPGWFGPDGVVTAHQRRDPYGYRGPHRRLQMTLDCLGKLVDAALALRDGAAISTPAADPGPHLPIDRDEWIPFDPDRPAGVWTYRSRDLAFVLPVVGATVSDYLPVPRNPGLFEVPVDASLPVGVPAVFRGRRVHTSGLLPTELSKEPAALQLRYDGFPEAGLLDTPADPAVHPGQRRVVHRVEGRTLRVRETLSFPSDDLPDALSLSVVETTGRPLRVEFDCHSPHATTIIDTSGTREWRSFWAELPRLHQIDVDPAPEVSLSYAVTPKFRVLVSDRGHHYNRSLYDPLAERVVDTQIPFGRLNDPAALDALLARYDFFHLHWPEWFLGPEIERHDAFIAALRRSGVRVVWTQHNLIPHVRDDRLPAIYQRWAEAADAAIHHSIWGRDRICERYDFSAATVHRVIPHGHWGNLMTEVAAIDRGEAEAALGLRSGVLRLGVIGAPRPEKDVGLVIEAVRASARQDIELLVLSLGPEDPLVTDDPRIHTYRYEFVPRATYNSRLRTIDVLVQPFAAGELLTTGTVGDAVGLGLPSLVSDWPFLTEVLRDAAIPYGRTREDLTACIDALDPAELDRAAAAARRLQSEQSWERAAEELFTLLEDVGTTRL